MELHIERSAEPSHRVRVERCPALVVPLETSVVGLEIDGTPEARLDRASVALVPAGAPYRLRPESAVTTVATLLVGRDAQRSAIREYRPHIDAERFAALLGVARVLPRTRWVDELVHRYVFERDVCEKHGSAAAAFLETELAKEIYFLAAERSEMRGRATVVHEEADVVVRARAFIDANLFEPIRVADLAKRAGASESTLLRAFRRELGQAPAGYARERRLDAALLLLQSGRHSVSEVAARVGYATLAAFTAAFRRRFQRAPSSVLHEGASDGLEILPPHGKPPRHARARRRKRASL
jgi:AraC-like DNA-binding protein